MTQLLQNAAYGTAMILAAAVLRRVLKDRLLPEARLALWAVCLFRLLTPAAPESVLSLWGLSRLFAPKQPSPSAPAPAPQLYIPSQAAPSPADPGFPWETVLFAVWLAVGGLLAARCVLSWRRTRRAVACAIPLDRDDPRYSSLPKCARLREGPMEGAPLTFGALRPTVVLSPGLEGVELACVLAHEGVHASRRDNLWHYAMALALVAHWWNPAVWLMARLLRRDIELSCDRAALKRLGADRRAEYANALVSLATQAEGPGFCQTFGRKAAEERIISIMKFKKTSIIGVVFSLTLVLALTAAFASEPKEPDEYDSASTHTSVELDGKTPDDSIVPVPDIEATKGIQSDLPSVDPDDVDLSMMKERLAKLVADGKMAQEEMDRELADMEDMLEQARRGELKLFLYPDGSILGSGIFSVNGGDPYVLDRGFTLDGSNYPWLSGELLGEGEIHHDDDYDVKLPTFDEDGSPAAADGGIIGKRFYDYTIVGTDENGYPLDEQGNHLVFDENGNLFMEVRKGYSPCIKEDCPISETHYHDNSGNVVYVDDQNPVPEPTPVGIPDMDSGLIPAMGTNGKVGYIHESDTLEGQYGPVTNPDEAMKYMEWLSTQPASYTIPLYDAAGNVIGAFPMSNPAAKSVPASSGGPLFVGQGDPGYVLEDDPDPLETDWSDPSVEPRHMSLKEYGDLLDSLVSQGRMTRKDADGFLAYATECLEPFIQAGTVREHFLVMEDSGSFMVM